MEITMKSNLVYAAVVALSAVASLISAAPALAGEATPDYPVAYTSTVSRAEVQQAALQARAAGLVASGERSVVNEPTGSTLTRAQVVAETREAIRVGAIAQGEASVVLTPAQLDSIQMAGLKAQTMTLAAR
jgi:Domain of unknown function (DUF4148)